MPLNYNLNTRLTPVQETAINDAFNEIIANINAAVPQVVNLSDYERNHTRTVNNMRLPYAARAVKEFGPEYPHLNSIAVPLAIAENNFAFYTQLSQAEIRLKGLLDLIGDLKINSGYLVMKFTDHQFKNAKNYRSGNVRGADTVYHQQLPMNEKKKKTNEAPATSAGELPQPQ